MVERYIEGQKGYEETDTVPVTAEEKEKQSNYVSGPSAYRLHVPSKYPLPVLALLDAV